MRGLKDITWQFKLANQFKENEAWIEVLSKLRGKEFYDNGKRPAFKLSNGEFYGRDEFETASHHVLAYDRERLVGAIRLLPLQAPSYRCISSEIVGENLFETILKELFNKQKKIMEINRLIVDKEYQHLKLGVYLCAAASFIAEKLDYFRIANGNINVLKAFHLKYLGGVLFPKYEGPYCSEYYNDNEIYLVYFDTNLMSPYFLRQMEIMKSIITLSPFQFEIDPSKIIQQENTA